MKAILTDLELDLKEIKYLITNLLAEPDTELVEITKRRIFQIQSHLEKLTQEVESLSVKKDTAEIIPEEVEVEIVPVEQINASAPVEKEDLSEPVKTGEEQCDKEPVASVCKEPVGDVPQNNVATAILAECLKPSISLKKSFTLNDNFRFTRELFGGDAKRMEQVLNQIEAMNSLEHVQAFLDSVLILNTEEAAEAFNEFQEIIKKHFM